MIEFLTPYIGKVNLATGKLADKTSPDYTTVWSYWKESDKDSYILCYEDAYRKYKDKVDRQWRAVITSSPPESAGKQYQVDDTIKFMHDQLGYDIGDTWTIVGVYPNTKQGLLDMAAKTGKKSFSFATFK